jgi:hypothetical protein
MKLIANIVVVFAAAVILYENCRKHLAGRISVDRNDLEQNKIYRFFRKISPYLLYLLAALILLLQFTLTFDNVLWGDEAYSATTVRGHSFADILQIEHFLDSHPPLYYFWLKICTDVMGLKGWTLHFASYIWFLAVIVFALTIFRKRYGKLSAAFLIIFAGFARSCAEYVQEVRMYEMAFALILFCLYSLDLFLREDKFDYYIPAVIFALGGAYSHYYALMLGGILLFLSMVISQIRYGGKTFLKGIAAMVLFFIGYLPWLGEVLYKFKEHSGNWWMTANSPANECRDILFGSANLFPYVLGIFLMGAAIMLIVESGVIEKTATTPRSYVIRTPKTAEWSVEIWMIVMGVAAILLELVIVLTASKLVVPMIAKRYLYPSTAVVAYLLAISVSGGLKDLKAFGKEIRKAGKVIAVLALLAFLITAAFDFRAYRAEVKQQAAATEQVLGFIAESGASGENLVLVNNGVTHIGWTVLPYYYPEAEVINGGYDSTDADDFWVFAVINIDEATLNHMRNDKGYNMDDYGIQQVAKYPCFLYHFYR